VGFDSRQSLGEKETGAKAALPIWLPFMKAAIMGKDSEQFLSDSPEDEKQVTSVAKAGPKPGTFDAEAGKPDTPAVPVKASAQAAVAKPAVKKAAPVPEAAKPVAKVKPVGLERSPRTR
jgi:penicillin-binding protein 1A